MSSILTNNSAMVALQTLKTINNNLGKTQEMISTGKKIGTARDNAAIWSISKTMESDVQGFKAITDSLKLGKATVAVGRNAAESITNTLRDIKGKVVAAQSENVDRTKIQTDITALRDQIKSIVKSAQFNGLNLVDGSKATVNILSSLDRAANGSVTSSSIGIDGKDLSTGAYAAKAALTGSTGVSADGDTAGFFLNKAGANTGNIVVPAATTFAAGDSITVSIGDQAATYTVSASDVAATTTSDIVAVGLKNSIDALGISGLSVDYDSGTAGQLTLKNDGTSDTNVSAQFKNAGSGGLSALAALDVSTAAGATAALGNIETLISTAIDASASFGSAEGRIENQATFISNLTDSLTSGIGAMVDADMEEASARLQALQVQQQLGVQALSIANQAPQSILSLFR